MYNISVHLSVDANKSVADAWCLIPIATVKRATDGARQPVFSPKYEATEEKKKNPISKRCLDRRFF